MLFGLLFVLPIAVISWLLVKLVRPKSRISFENLHQNIYFAIVLVFVVGFIAAIIGTVAYQIFWYHPWVLAIIVVSWSGIGLVSLIGHLTQKVRQRRQGQTAT
jgi:Sec-independent protein secretion pathway component TatC